MLTHDQVYMYMIIFSVPQLFIIYKCVCEFFTFTKVLLKIGFDVRGATRIAPLDL